MTGQLGAPFGSAQDRIVADHHARQPATLGDAAQLATRRPDSEVSTIQARHSRL
jgi:hypothetical protein